MSELKLTVESTSFTFGFTKVKASASKNRVAGRRRTPELLESKVDLVLEVRDTDELVKELEENKARSSAPTINTILQKILRKALANRSEDNNDTISVSVSMLDSSDSDPDDATLTTEVRVTGEVLSFLFSEYNGPMQLNFCLFFHSLDLQNIGFNMVFVELSPSITKDGVYVFQKRSPEMSENTIRNKIKVGNQYEGKVSIELKAVSPNKGSIPLPSTHGINANILRKGIESDFALMSDNGSGKRFPCHKAFLAAHSTVLANVLKSDFKEMKEGIYPISMTEEGVTALLNYFYVAEVKEAIKSPSIAFELLEAADKYDIPDLRDAIKAVFLNHSTAWVDIDVALRLYIFTSRVDGNDQLKLKAFQVMKSKADELVESDLFDELYKADPTCVKEIMRLAFKAGSASVPYDMPTRKKRKRSD